MPFVCLKNLIAAVADTVAKHKRHVLLHKTIQHVIDIIINNSNSVSKGLTWHNGAIPENELWVKFGGNKGHGSFKFNLQLCNTEHPNSQKSTTLVSVFKAGDSTTNLHVALDMYREHITELQGMKLKYVYPY